MTKQRTGRDAKIPKVRPARVVIEGVKPSVDGGAFAAKAIVDEPLTVEADVFSDGHDLLRCVLSHRAVATRSHWTRTAMQHGVNDRWYASIRPESLGGYEFAISATVDAFGTWLHELHARHAAGQDLKLALETGAALLMRASARARGKDRRELRALAEELKASDGVIPLSLEDPARQSLASLYGAETPSARSGTYRLDVDRKRAEFGFWYEIFPRSAASQPGRHGTFNDVEQRLDYLVGLGVDVLYLPPIHPIGVTNRKGRDGATLTGPDDPGSPWAIGSDAGGHQAVHTELGSLEDFEHLLERAKRLDIEVALDLAFQCSPDHPWVSEHPEWFKHLPDGSIAYAENPPKRYEDIFPLNFDTESWPALWQALHEVVDFWIAHGVRIFRVDNPHTKPFRFWEWLIQTVKAEHPDVLFLAEAFTRPKIMYELAKLGFSQSYTYFAWRYSAWELRQYFAELGDVAAFFRPNLWPNTPDILTEQLQSGGVAAFVVRAVLAATLGANYGIYGPAFELAEHEARAPGSEEYKHSEKYEIRNWKWDASTPIARVLTKLNTIRRNQLALQHDNGLAFHDCDNAALLVYSKTVRATEGGLLDPKGREPIVVVVNLDSEHQQSGWVTLDLASLGIDEQSAFLVEDLMSGERYRWLPGQNFVLLDPSDKQAHLFRVEEMNSLL